MKTGIKLFTLFCLAIGAGSCTETNTNETVNTESTADTTFTMGVKAGKDLAYEELEVKASLSMASYGNLPVAASLKKYAPYPKNQDNAMTCTAWASAYCARTIQEALINGWTDRNLITEEAFNPSFQFRVVEPKDDPCAGGAYTSACVKSLRTVGSVKFKESQGIELPCPDATPSVKNFFATANTHKITAHNTLFNNKKRGDKVMLTKKSLSEDNPVVITMSCPRSFMSRTDRTTGLWEPLPHENSSTRASSHGVHAMCVVGYDDEKFGSGAFEIQNSWGTLWGNQGYCWVKYEHFDQFVLQAYELITLQKAGGWKIGQDLFAGGLRMVKTGEELAVVSPEPTRNWTIGTDESLVEDYTYKFAKPFKENDCLRMYINASEAAYVYVLTTTAGSDEVEKLIPFEGESALLNYTGAEVVLPSDETDCFIVDNGKGKAYFIMLYSKEELDIADIQSKIKAAKGSISKKVKAALGERMLDGSKIDFTQDKINFTAKKSDKGGDVMVMLIESEHNM